MARNILLAVTGLIQKPIVQALWYFTIKKQIVFDEIIILTTTRGNVALKSQVDDGDPLFLDGDGVLSQFYSEYGIEPILVTAETMISSAGSTIEDVRNKEEFECVAYSVINSIRKMRLDESDNLFCIFSGGRRTMVSYLTSALILIGKKNCRLYYLDVEPESLLRTSEFNYPPRKPTIISTPKGPVRTSDIRIQAVEIEFPKLGEKYSDVVRRDKNYLDMVSHIQNLISNEKKPIYESNTSLETEPVIVGKSKSLIKAISDIKKLAHKNTGQVLLMGESGTGKEIFAEYFNYHYYKYHPERIPKKLTIVNCGSLPEKLIESELYGYYKGAHSEAITDKKGKLERADQGVVFLDEIHTTSLHTQVSLLRFLENREIQKLGDSGTDESNAIKIDAIVLLGSNEDLNQLVEEDKMRGDFNARISMFDIQIPPLRERRGDIRDLVKYFIEAECDKQNIKKFDFSEDLYQQLEKYDWPNNVRELKDFVALTVVLTEEKNIITEFPRPEKIDKSKRRVLHPISYEKIACEIMGNNWEDLRYAQRRDTFEKWMLYEEYKSCGYVATKLAKKLNVKPSTIQGRLKRFGISKPK